MAQHFDSTAPGFEDRWTAYMAAPRGTGSDVAETVAEILQDVSANGAASVVRLTLQFDGLDLVPGTLQAPGLDLDELAERCPPDVASALAFAAERIERFHEAQRPADHSFTDEHGARLGWRWTAMESVGLYVPGGRASYPSSVLMNALPARLAGVERIAMAAPAPGGVLSPAVAHAAKLAGVTEYYPIGGAQAVAAFAFGAGPLRPVDKIVGPGNAYVAEAKRQVFGRVGIDTVAGPSEILVIADRSARADWVAADLLSQCEHDPSSRAVLLTTHGPLAEAVAAEAKRQLEDLPSSSPARESWSRHSAIVLCRTLKDAAGLTNRLAPEHLELCVADPDGLLKNIRHAGAVFLGHHAPEALGDYVTGSNHVLPTDGAARFSAGLGLTDFMKKMSVQSVPESAFRALAPAAMTLAEAEGLAAHRRSVAIRLDAGG